jgi:release factor glutamine methyltransferase
MPKTYNDHYIRARKALKAAGVSSYSLEARILVAHAAGKPMDKFMAGLNLYTGDEMEKTVDNLIAQRLSGEPVAYITGEWEFYGLPFLVDRSVLIPRVDTEVLVDTVLNYARASRPDARILDLCAGSGCIGCALARNLPKSRVVLGDVSMEAVSICRRNVLLNNLSPRVTSIDLDAREDPPMLVGSFDIIVSNPPYIPSGEIDGLDVSVRDYEPHLALDGGNDGLDFYRIIIEKWTPILRPGGYLFFEVGQGQADEVSKLLRLGGFKNVTAYKDTLDIDRVIAGKI